jgi:HEAT repeat protein
MKRVLPFVVSCVLMSSGAWAQTTQTPPPPPPPTPVTPPSSVPPVPVIAPMAPTPPPTIVWQDRLMAPVTVAPMVMPVIQTPQPPGVATPHDFTFTYPDVWTHQSPMTFVSRGSDAYSVAMGQLERRQYEQAITSFDRVITAKATRADAAMHWKAFSQFRLGRWDDSLATISQLRKDHPQSRYLAEAKVLEADVRRFSGQTLKPEQIDDDEIKLIALSALQRTDPERALPLVEHVLNANNSLKVKKQALFVLAQSELPRAQQVLLGYAKGQGNPDLQTTAIGYVASRRSGQTTGKDLMTIYESTTDPAIRMAIINALRTSGNREPLVMIATDHAAPQPVRERAVTNLNGLISPQELLTLYQKESNRDLRIQMVNVFSSMRAVDQLTQIVRNEKEPTVRQRAIRALGGLEPAQTGKTLSDLYDANSDVETRRTIVAALGAQNNAEALIAIARKETNLSMKSEIVKRIAGLAPKSKPAADYLAEIVR